MAVTGSSHTFQAYFSLSQTSPGTPCNSQAWSQAKKAPWGFAVPARRPKSNERLLARCCKKPLLSCSASVCPSPCRTLADNNPPLPSTGGDCCEAFGERMRRRCDERPSVELPSSKLLVPPVAVLVADTAEPKRLNIGDTFAAVAASSASSSSSNAMAERDFATEGGHSQPKVSTCVLSSWHRNCSAPACPRRNGMAEMGERRQTSGVVPGDQAA
mmetsp:Transcript_82960/g.238423  ORF Transcript_82960/g.238423 Transcript_82960/m.238423 type:complete len:215 (+) Transcript_82960:238-882(+)